MALLSAKPIITWCNVNDYVFGNQWVVNQGDSLTLYFQIIDTNQAIASPSGGILNYASIFSGITPVGTTAGLRYLLGIGTQNQPYSVKVTFPSLDPTQAITLTATQADPNDSSIWQVYIPSNVTIGGGNVMFTINQGTSINRFSVLNMLDVLFPFSNGMC
jgi:hypothetical protein